MPRAWVTEIGVPQTVSEIYLVKRKAMPRSPTNGRAYLSLVLADRTGDLDARVWDNVERLTARFEEDDFVRVEGRTVLYQGRLQLHISSLDRVPEEGLSADDFLPKAAVPSEDLFERTQQLLETITNPHLRALLDAVMADEAFVEAYRKAPGGKTIHHARLGGLMEHNLTMCQLIEGICATYAETLPGMVDRDLLIAAAVLHDCGKTLELSTDRRFDYTDAGRLVGHVVLGFEYVSRTLATIPAFPEDLALHLKHLLLSHHGELEHGAPKRPKTVEAWILHFVDILDCRVAQTADLVRGLPAGGWTPYQKLYDRYFWRGHQGPAEEPPAEPDSRVAAPSEPPTEPDLERSSS